MIELNHYEDLTIDLPVDVYNALNRASREYESSVTDLYYHITNKGNFESSLFNELFNEAIDAYFKYEHQRNIVSTEYVIPAVRNAFNASETASIENHWLVAFDGSHKCTITQIIINENNQQVLYDEPLSDEWIEPLPVAMAKRDVFDALASRLITVINDNEATKNEYNKIKQARIDTVIKYDEKAYQLNNWVVDNIVNKANKEPRKCRWSIDYTSKRLVVTSTD